MVGVEKLNRRGVGKMLRCGPGGGRWKGKWGSVFKKGTIEDEAARLKSPRCGMKVECLKRGLMRGSACSGGEKKRSPEGLGGTAKQYLSETKRFGGE